MDKDRSKFGPEYGERFCMLSLVGRHEMDKVVLQKESDGSSSSNAQKILVGARGRAGHARTGAEDGWVGTYGWVGGGRRP